MQSKTSKQKNIVKELIDRAQKCKCPANYTLKQCLADSLNNQGLDSDVESRARGFIQDARNLAVFQKQGPTFFKSEQDGLRFLKRLMKAISRKVPCRQQEIMDLVFYIYAKLTGSDVVKAPFLVGPPGTGKTYLVESLVEAMNICGISTGFYRAVCRHDVTGLHVTGLEGDLIGTECIYSNAQPGMIAKLLVSDGNDLAFIFIDELEKGIGTNIGLMLNLFDPSAPLKDHFLNGVFRTVPHDLRKRLLVVAGGNNHLMIEKISELRDRLDLIPFTPYSVQEKIAVVTRIYKEKMSSVATNKIGEQRIKKRAERILKTNEDMSIRHLLASIEKELLLGKLLNKNDYHLEQDPWQQLATKPTKRRVGFTAKH